MTTPSSASERESAGMLPGSRPPTSAWCARVTAKPSVGARDERDVGQVGAAGVGVVEDEDLAVGRPLGDDGGDGVRHRAEVDGDVLGLGDHPAALVEERGRAVAPLLDVRRERGADEGGAHLLGDRAQRAADDLELNVHARRDLQASPSLAPTHPRGSQQVAPSSSSTCGPDTSAGHPAPAGGRAADDVGGAHGDELDRARPVGVAVPLLVRAVERLGDVAAERHGQLERLAARSGRSASPSAGSSPASASGTTYERT